LVHSTDAYAPLSKRKISNDCIQGGFCYKSYFIAHPVQTQAVTYIVQRMTSMAAMFYLLSMVFYVKGRQSVGKRQFLYYGAMGISGIFSIFSKENAFMCLSLSRSMKFYSLDQGWRSSGHRPMLKIVILLASIGLIGFILLGGKYIDTIKEGYQYRDFTMSERVLTQFRVVLYYLSLLIYPHPSRLNLDYDFPISRTLFDPISTVLSLMVIFFLIGIGSGR